MKPPNVQPVYPLRDESKEMKTLINIASSEPKKGPIIIINTETLNPRSALF